VPLLFGNPYTSHVVQLVVETPTHAWVTVDGFYDGLESNTGYHVFMGRMYCGEEGTYNWHVQSLEPLITCLSGSVVSSRSGTPDGWKGKLRLHPDDPHQMMYDNGEWFLHIGDTGYRYPVPQEKYWKEFIDQSVSAMGTTKIRVWFGRSSIEALYSSSTQLDLATWRIIESRILYALETYPWVQLQVIVYGEDDGAVADAATTPGSIQAYVSEYAQARWSAFPNVHWCVLNDRSPSSDTSAVASIMYEREAWGSLITS
jgi:hypothetical protein